MELVGLGRERQRSRMERVRFDQRDDGRVVLRKLVEALFHLRMLGDAVAADLREIGLKNPGVFLGEGLGLQFLDERPVFFQERGERFERTGDDLRALPVELRSRCARTLRRQAPRSARPPIESTQS